MKEEDLNYTWGLFVFICAVGYFGSMLVLALQDFSILILILGFFICSIIFVFVLYFVAMILVLIQEADSGEI